MVYGGQTSAQRFPQPTKIVLPSPLCADRFGSVIFLKNSFHILITSHPRLGLFMRFYIHLFSFICFVYFILCTDN